MVRKADFRKGLFSVQVGTHAQAAQSPLFAPGSRGTVAPMRALPMLFAAPVLLASVAAQAQPAEPVVAGLDWRREPGAEHCLSAAGLQKAVESRLGRRVFVPLKQADVVVRARLEPADGGEGWTAELSLASAAGQPMGKRVLSTRADDCSALDASLALVVALMIDIPRSELPPPPKSTPAPPAPPTTQIRLPRETPAPRRPWGIEGHARGVAALGLMPGAAFGLGVGVGVKPPGFWYTELDGELWAPRRAESASGGSGSRFSLQTLELYLCPLALGSRGVRVRLCVGQRVGRLVADGFGYDEDLHAPRVIYNPGMRARVSARIVGPLVVGAGVGLEAPLLRDRFVATRADGTTEQLYRMAPIVGTAAVLVGVRFGRR